MGKRKERPDGIVLYQQSLQTLALLPDEQAGKAVKAAVAYFTTGETPDEAPTMEYLAFSILKVDIDAALTRFSTKCEQNRRNRNGGDQSSPVVTDGDQNRTELNLSEQNLSESELKGSEAAQPPHTRARDSRGIVCLDDREYNVLLNDMGETELLRCINYVSEYSAMSGRTYKDWSAAVAKCHRQQWGVTTPKGAQPSADFQPSSDRIKQHNEWIDSFLEEQRKQQDSKSRWNLEAIEL